MAENSFSRQHENHQVFLRHLQERYNTPSEEWRTTVQDTFTELCKILGHREAVPILGREETPEVISARTARDHALPSITVLPTGTHALRLTATNEPLDCICFGTMSPKTYVAVFWELVVEVQRSGNYTLIIHEVDAGPVPRFLLSFESLLFEVRYYHCNALVRKYPNIVEAPTPFLDDRSNSEKIVQDVIERLKQEQTLCEYLDSNRLLRDLYHYIRAWAIVRGLFGSWDLTAHDILRLYHDTDEDPDNASNHGDQSFPALILCFFEDNPYRSAVPRGKYDGVWNLSAPSDSDDNLEGSEQDTEDGLEMPRGCPRFRPYKLFRKVEAQPLHKRLAFSHYIRVKVLPMSPSKMKIAACISVVERRLQKLKERLEQRLSGNPEIKIWPGRLVTPDTKEAINSTYEGCFMLGLNTEYAGTDIPAARDVVMQWEKEICVERVILEADATIDVLIYYGNYELRELNLEPCTISWPRPILKAEEQGHNVQKQDSDSVASPLKNPKRDKKYRLNVQEQQTNTKSGSLRRAMDVLDRLLWDGTYDIDEFVVGYTDRHSTLPLEKLALDWVKDTTDENWVPEHKIEYFKRYYDGKSEVLWDKATRLDKIFTKKAV